MPQIITSHDSDGDDGDDDYNNDDEDVYNDDDDGLRRCLTL